MARTVEKSERKKVLLVDDHPVVRESLCLRLAQEPDLEVCAQAGNAVEARKALEHHQPDLVVVDMNLPDGHGLELIKDIVSQDARTRILVFSMHDENLFGERALRAGAQGYVMKSESPDTVLLAMRRVLGGKLAVSDSLSHRLLTQVTRKERAVDSPMQLLSDRELEVFQLIGQALGTKAIANHLHLSIKTIESHRARIKQKLGIGSATELVAAAARWAAESPSH